jgi:nitrilase
MRVAAIQMTSSAEVAENLAAAEALIERAAGDGAILAALPENFALMGLHDADKLAVGEPDGDGPIQAFLARVAARYGVWLVGGTIPLKVPGERRVAAACLVYDARGARVGRYDKIHLFDVDLPGRGEAYRESANMAPGSEPHSVETPVGRLGLAVCYDVRFPELFRLLGAQGVDGFVLPSAFTAPTGRAHWETLLRARAIENLAYVIAPAQAGVHANRRETHGDSMVVDYWGRILGRLPSGPGEITVELDLAAQREARATFPALRHRVL